MKKLLVVEDEYLVRIGICSLCNWEEHGYVLIGNACDGSEALSLIEKDVPDILLTDLMMQGMDGFELIRQCKIRYPSIAIVVLSNYNDFDSVKRAMQLGAVDYILKLTTMPQDLLDTLDKIPVAQSACSLMEAQEVLIQHLSPIRSHLLTVAIEGSYSSLNSFTAQCKQVGLCLSWDEPFVVQQITIDDYADKVYSREISEPVLVLSTMEHIVEEAYAKLDYEHAVIIHGEGSVVVLCSCQGLTGEQMDASLNGCFHVVRENMARFLGLTVSASVSNVCSSVSDLAVVMLEREHEQHRPSWHATGQFMNTRENIKRTVQYISDHIDEHLSLSLLSSVAAMSECYYSHVFKLETGIGVKDYINQVRIKKAKQLLRETDLKIAGIALAIGITNTNYFSVFFKRLTDKTPIEYRNLPGD